jgi:hypothetical protein
MFLKACSASSVMMIIIILFSQAMATTPQHAVLVHALPPFLFLLVTRGGVTLLAGHTHQPDESDCGGLQHCCH